MSPGKKIVAFWQEVGHVITSNAMEIVHWDWKWLVVIPVIGLAYVPPMFGWTVAKAFGLSFGQ